MKKKNIIRVLSLLLCLMTLASLTTLTAFASDHAAVDSETTEDITATVSYSLRVRATLGLLTSAWSTLKHRFNQNSSKALLFLLPCPQQPLLQQLCSLRLLGFSSASNESYKVRMLQT